MAGDPADAPILIADDESEDRYLLEKTLRKAGAKNAIIAFRDGAELVDFITDQLGQHRTQEEIASVVFLDLKMPLVDGFDTLRWIRGNPPVERLRVVIVSGSNHPRDLALAQELGVVRYLEKYPNAQTVATVLTAS